MPSASAGSLATNSSTAKSSSSSVVYPSDAIPLTPFPSSHTHYRNYHPMLAVNQSVRSLLLRTWILVIILQCISTLDRSTGTIRNHVCVTPMIDVSLDSSKGSRSTSTDTSMATSSCLRNKVSQIVDMYVFLRSAIVKLYIRYYAVVIFKIECITSTGNGCTVRWSAVVTTSDALRQPSDRGTCCRLLCLRKTNELSKMSS